jgi:Protein of unknown function (DUF1761)
MPDIQISVLAIFTAVVANFMFGYFWYTPLFGRAWAKEVGLDFDKKPAANEMIKSLGLNILGNFFLAYVLAQNIAAWTPKTWGLATPGLAPISQSMTAAFFVWLGFVVPVLLNGVAWEKKSWKLFAINGGYYFFTLLIAALIITHL